MKNPREEKISIKDTIIAAIKRDGKADRATLTSSLKLESGFSEKVIKEIIDDLVKVSYIVDDAGTLMITNKERFGGEE